jgi:hypothetical protein
MTRPTPLSVSCKGLQPQASARGIPNPTRRPPHRSPPLHPSPHPPITQASARGLLSKTKNYETNPALPRSLRLIFTCALPFLTPRPPRIRRITTKYRGYLRRTPQIGKFFGPDSRFQLDFCTGSRYRSDNRSRSPTSITEVPDSCHRRTRASTTPEQSSGYLVR